MARALVIGAGPAGMAAAACLQRRRIPYVLVDRRGVSGGAFRHIYPRTVLSSPARYTALPGLPLRTSGEYIRAGDYLAYLDRYAAHHRLSVERAEIVGLVREPGGFHVYFADRVEPAHFTAVIAATGMFDFPVWPMIPGLDVAGTHPQVLHAKDWPGPAPFRNRRLLIVGGATSAVEIAEECAGAGLSVTLSARSGVHLTRQRFLGRDLHDYAYCAFDLLPRWALGSHCERRPTLPTADLGFTAFRDAGLIQLRGQVERFEGAAAVFAPQGAAPPDREAFDAVVLATGYRFETPYLPAGVPRAAAGHLLADDGEVRRWPGLFLLGSPCANSLSSEFLYGIGHDARLIARRIEAWTR